MFSIFRTAPDSELIFVASDSGVGGGSFSKPHSGDLLDLGFANGSNQPIVSRQPTEKQLDQWVLYDNLRITLDENCRGIGQINMRERLAYDLHNRSEICWTGIMVEMRLSGEAHRRYEDYLTSAAVPGANVGCMEAWSSVIFRIPVKEFALPARRGGLNEDMSTVGKLRNVARFEIKKIEVQMLSDEQGKNVNARDGLPETRNGLPLPLIIG